MNLTRRSDRRAQQLEDHLAEDPAANESFAAARIIADDEAERFPEDACRALDCWGMHELYVPRAHGGRLESFDELLAVLRVVARRDLTVAIAHAKTFLGAAPVWIGGSAEQRERLARRVLRGEPIALALTERNHGSDLVGAEVEARAVRGGFVLRGEKWLVNNATRSTAMSLLAKTDPAGGARALTVFLVEKDALGASSYSHHPKILTHGIRGADISGIAYNGAAIGADNAVGPIGHGLELTYKTLQVTRTLCSGLSLGAADASLRTVLAFARRRELYHAAIIELPVVRRTLVTSFVDLIICECVAVAAVRALHAAPEQMSVVSAVVKYFVPTLIEEVVRELAVVLGARHYLRVEYMAGIFQKIMRDNALVGLFDGSTMVNLNALALQLRSLTDEGVGNGATPAMRTRLAATFDVAADLPVFDAAKLEVTSAGANDPVRGLEFAMEVLAASTSCRARSVQRALDRFGTALLEERRICAGLAGEAHARFGAHAPRQPEMYQLARRYTWLHAGACCLHLYAANASSTDEFFASGEWTVAALERIIARLRPPGPQLQPEIEDALFARLVALADTPQTFSLWPLSAKGAPFDA